MIKSTLIRELSPFEHIVLLLMCAGDSNASIAKKTRRSIKVIENTLSRSARAFDITSHVDNNIRIILALAYRCKFGDEAAVNFGYECDCSQI
jgi:DNA-binding CsgD family transcriptional regulator